jgi:hypothetical protein
VVGILVMSNLSYVGVIIIVLGGVLFIETVITLGMEEQKRLKWQVYSGTLMFLLGLSCGLCTRFVYPNDDFFGLYLGWLIAAIYGAVLVGRVIAFLVKSRHKLRREAYRDIVKYSLICLIGLSFGIVNYLFFLDDDISIVVGIFFNADWLGIIIYWLIASTSAVILIDKFRGYRKILNS